MFRSKIFLCISSIFFIQTVSADYNSPYQSGKEIYQSVKDTYPRWEFLNVPISYDKVSPLNHETTYIAYKFFKPFDPNKKTVLYFEGGPGISAAVSKLFLDEFNVLIFEQRGVGFSRAPTLSLHQSKSYYSSFNTANDAYELIKHLKLKDIAVYGGSAGTVPATIFASIFKHVTTNVVLEGTVYDSEYLMNKNFPHEALQIMQKAFDELNSTLKAKILKYSNDSRVPKYWFTMMAGKLMYGFNFKDALKKKLDNLFSKDDLKIVEQLQKTDWIYEFDDVVKDKSLAFSETTFYMIKCKEAHELDGILLFVGIFQDEKIVPFTEFNNSAGCRALGFSKEDTHPYRATDYPLEIPVVYFQGSHDSATPLSGAMAHFTHVAKGPAQIVIGEEFGHLILFESFADYSSQVNPVPITFRENLRLAFIDALLNKSVNVDQVNKVIPIRNHLVKLQK